jgi:hypothetical protein
MRDSIARHLGLTAIPEEFLTGADVPENLEKQIATIKPVLVIIDSLRAFKPEVTAKNADAAAWLKEIRQWARAYDCSFLIAHHLRKENRNAPSRPLKGHPVNTWLEEMEGPRAFTNQTDTRIAVEASKDGLEIKWNRRLSGDSPLLSAERVFDQDGEPLGYRHPTGIECLSPEDRTALDRLPDTFRFTDARRALSKTDKPTNDFLQQCIRLEIVKKLPHKGGYRKISTDSGASLIENREVEEVA